MKFKTKLTIALCLLFVSLAASAQVMSDDAGNHLNVEHPPKRIISLAPHITELIFTIGAGSSLVGEVSGGKKTNVPVVGTASGLDLERVISLQPDLIITWGNTFSRQVTVLKKMGIPVYVSDPKHLMDVYYSLINIGILLHHEEAARLAAQHFKAQIDQLKTANQTKKKVKVYYQIGDYSLITINKNSWINDVISLCGGENVFAESYFTAPEISWEGLFQADPEVIISDSEASDWQRRFKQHAELKAVKNHALFAINPDELEQATVSLASGASQLCAILDQVRGLA